MKPDNKRRKIRVVFLKWHRKSGVLMALFVVLLALSGLLINHSHSLGWDRSPVRLQWLIRYYGISLPPIDSGYLIDSHWITLVGETLYWNASPVAPCAKPLSGAVSVDAMVAVQCGNGLVLLTNDGQIIETLLGQPEPINLIGLQGTQLLAKGASGLFTVDLESGTWISTPSSPLVSWSHAQKLPADIQQLLEKYNVAPDLTWERVLLDFHSGRLFGRAGSLLVDLLGILLILSAVSGWWAWHTSPRHKV